MKIQNIEQREKIGRFLENLGYFNIYFEVENFSRERSNEQ